MSTYFSDKLLVANQITAGQMQAQAALEEQRAFLRQVIDTNPNAIFVINRESRYTMVNETGARFIGAPIEDVIGKTDEELNLSKDQVKKFSQQDRQVLDSLQEMFIPDGVTVFPDGKKRRLQVVKRPLIAADGRADHVLLVLVDITERVQAQEALEEQRSFLKQVIDTSPNSIFVRNREGRYTLVNEIGARFIGAPIEDVIGKTDEELNLRKDQIEKFLQEDREIMDTLQEKFIPEEETVFPDGKKRWLQVVKRPLIAADGRTDQVLVVLVDITERVQTQEALRESEGQFRTLFETMSEGVILIAPDEQIVQANPMAEQLLGIERSEIEGQNYTSPEWKIIRTDGTPMPAEEMAGPRAMEEKRPVKNVEMGIVRPDDSITWINVSASPIMDENDSLEGIVGTFLDITERVQAANLQRIQRDLGVLFDSTGNLADVLNRLLESVLQIEGVDSGGVYLVDEVTGELDLAAHQGLSPQFVASASHYHAGAPQARLVAAGDPIYVDYTEFLPGTQDEVRKREGLRSLAVIPVRYAGKIVVALNLASHAHTKTPTATRNMLEAFASQTGGFIARIKAEAALRESEKRFRALFEQAGDAVLVHNKEEQFVEVNEKACVSLGYSRDELMARSVSDIEVAWEPEALNELWEGLMPGEVKTTIGEQRRKDGSTFPVEVRLGQFRWQNQELMMVIARDITERKQAEEALHESEERFRSFAEQANVGVSLSDEEGILVTWNRALEEITGIGSGEALGSPYWEVVFATIPEEKKSPQLYERIKNAPTDIRRGEQIPFMDGMTEGEIMRADGNRRLVQIHSFPVKTARGLMVGAIHTDVTEQKQREAQLLAAQKMASLGTLAAGMAHEMNSPLQVVTGASDSLLRRIKGDKLDMKDLPGSLKMISSNAWRMAGIVRSLLDATRPSNGALAPHDLNTLVKDTLLLIEH